MKVRNIAIGTAKVGVQIATGVALYPAFVVLGTATVARQVSSVVEKVSAEAIVQAITLTNSVCEYLDTLKEKEVEIVKSPLGDEAVAVN